MIFSVIQSCIKTTVDEAMKEIFKELILKSSKTL